jgi:hypothetical protein
VAPSFNEWPAVQFVALGGTGEPDHRPVLTTSRPTPSGVTGAEVVGFTWLPPSTGPWSWATRRFHRRPRAGRVAAGPVHRPPGVHRRLATRSTAPSAGATATSTPGSCPGRRAHGRRAWTASPRSTWEVRNVPRTAAMGRRPGWPTRRADRDAPTPHRAVPVRVSRPPKRHRHLSACSAASLRAARNWPSWPVVRTAVSPGGPTRTTRSRSTSTVRHRSRLITSPQPTRHTRRPATEPWISEPWPCAVRSPAGFTDSAGDAVALGLTAERTSSTAAVSLRARALTTNYIGVYGTRLVRHSADRRPFHDKRSVNFGRADQAHRSALLEPREVRIRCR